MFTFSKGRVLKQLGLRPGEAVGRSVFDMYGDHKQIVSDTHRALNGESFISVTEVEGIIFESRYSPLKDGQDSLIGTIGVAVDITKRTKAENALRESEEKYRKLFNLESDALAFIDVKTNKIIEVNKSFINLYGYSMEEVLRMRASDFSTEPDETADAIRNRLAYIPLRYHKKKNGVIFPVEITANSFKYNGNDVYIAAIRDISDRKTIEEQIEASLKDKEILLNEIHHRVKNNFEIISSLLDMSSMNTKNQEIRNILRSSRTRIHSMAMIHSQLYQSERFDKIDMVKHINELGKYLLFLYGMQNKIDLVIESSRVYLSLGYAIPCTLILNELITNSLKYAFVDREEGKIKISIRRYDDGAVLLKVKDDGVGIPEGIDVKSGGLGVDLIKHLVVGQLKGEIRYNANNGTDVCIKFNT